MCFGELRGGPGTCRNKSCTYAHRLNFGTDHEYDSALLSMLNAQVEALLRTPIAQKLRLPNSTTLQAELKQYPLLVSAMRQPISMLAPPAHRDAGAQDTTRHHRVAFMDDETFVALQKKEPTEQGVPVPDTKQYLAQLDARLHNNEATTAARAAGASESPSS
jgi:hypothetical protein